MGVFQKFRSRLMVFLFLLNCCFAAKAQEPFLRNYSVSDGLPGFEVYDVFQDSKGFIWFGTDAGASCFDGYSFHNYTSRDNLPDNTIFGVYEDGRGRIWFRSYNGLLSYFDGQKIVQPEVNKELKKVLKGGLPLSIYVDPQDTLWLGLNGSTSLVCILPGFKNIYPPGSSTKCESVAQEMAPGQYQLYSKSAKGVNRNLYFSSPLMKTPLLLGQVEKSVHGLSCAKLSSGTTVLGISNQYYFIEPDGQQHMLEDSLFLNQVVPSRGAQRYWTCLSFQKGAQLVHLLPNGKREIKSYLKGYSVSDCLEDREGGVWFTTLEKGVFYMPYSAVEDISLPSLNDGERITSMCSFSHDGLLLSTSIGNLFLLDSGSISEKPVPLESRLGYTYSMFAFDNTVAIGANSKSILFHPREKKEAEITNEKMHINLGAVAELNEEELCALSINSVYRINKKTGEARLLYDLMPERMRCICKGNGDTLWLGGISGLWMLLPGKAPVDMGTLDPLLAQRIDFLYYDPVKNRLWLSSKGGGLLLKEGNRVSDFRNYQPAISATCRAICSDEEGNIWVATNAGAFCVYETANKKFTVREFSIRNGLSSNDIVGIHRAGDTVWMATPDHIIRFRLSAYPHNIIPPPLFMQKILVNGHEIDLTDSLPEFQYGNAISFFYKGLSYKSFGEMNYRFRLLGADNSWKETQATEATFYQLPPGNYRICISAFNNDGVSSAKPLEFGFVILPPVWQRWWFITSYIVIGLGAAVFFLRYRIHRVRRKELVNRRLIEMEMTALRAQMNPHFIFNAINSIHNFILIGDKNSSATYLSMFASLIRNVLENSALKQISLERELETLRLYIEIERLRFSDGFSFVIRTDPAIHLSSVMVVPMLLQPYVENAIWHGLLHKEGGGHLVVSVEDAGEMIRCVIDDDGVGRERSKEYERQSSIAKTSMGSEMALRRLNLLNNLYGTNYSVHYTDKQNADGTPAGTRVELMVPKN